MTPAQEEAGLGDRVRQEVERLLARGMKGFAYLRSDAPDVGRTPKDTIHSRGTLNLYHYRATTEDVYRTPVLLVMSLVSKPYILDLAPGQSLIEFLVSRGHDVYMIDWASRAPRTSGCGSRATCSTSCPTASSACSRTRASRGSRWSATAWAACSRRCTRRSITDGPLRNLACFTTPFNFDGMGLMKAWSDPKHFDVDRIVDTLGNVPPD